MLPIKIEYNTKTSEDKEDKEEKEEREEREEKVDELMMDGEGIEMPGIVGIDGKDGCKVRTDYGRATTSLIGTYDRGLYDWYGLLTVMYYFLSTVY